MSDRDVVTRAGKGASLNIANHDQNINAFISTSEEQTGATYEVVYTDQGKLIELNNASMVVTLDAIADIVAAMDSGLDTFSVTLKNMNAATATINRSSTDTIDSGTSLSLNQYESVTLQTNAAGDKWLMKSDAPQIYGGRVPADAGGELYIPPGWTITYVSTGRYTVTHNLGLSSAVNYPVVLTVKDAGSASYTIKTVGIGPNFFVYEIKDSSNVVSDQESSFIMMIP